MSPRYLIDDTEYMDRIYVYIRVFLFEFIAPFIARLLLYYVVKELTRLTFLLLFRFSRSGNERIWCFEKDRSKKKGKKNCRDMKKKKVKLEMGVTAIKL